MSEAAAADVPKKKKPIVPIAMVLIVLLGGGFFMMKGKGGKSAKPAVALAEKETELEEFLTNTQNQTIYVRAKIAVRLRKDYEETKLKDNMGDLRDAVLLVLNNTPPNEVTDPSKRKLLKKTLANAINQALEPDTGEDKPKKKHKSHKSDEESDDGPSTDDWDSLTGPVLKVRFMSLATQ